MGASVSPIFKHSLYFISIMADSLQKGKKDAQCILHKGVHH